MDKGIIPVIDVETTGLDPRDCYLLELSVTILDEDTLIPLGSRTWVFDPTAKQGNWTADRIDANAPADRQSMLDWIIARTDPYVQAMHTANGLWDELRTSDSLVSYARGSVQIAAYIAEFLEPNDEGVIPKPRLCGASPRLDLNFIDAFLPALADLLHYRMIDVSTLRYVLEQHSGYELPDRTADSSHRAADDVAWTVNLYQAINAELDRVWAMAHM